MQKNPSKPSLIFITTSVNGQTLQLLIDTGATSTFISSKALQKVQHHNFVKKQPHSFVLADGLSPFYVLGTIDLSIRFANQITKIQAKIAQSLCTDIILGMDYITLYNLQIDTKHQLISIEINNHRYYMKTNQNHSPQFTPVTLSKSLRLPSNTYRTIKVHTPISSINSTFIPNLSFIQHDSLSVLHKPLQLNDHLYTMTLLNTSPYPKFINKAVDHSSDHTSTRPYTTLMTNTKHFNKSITNQNICNTIHSIHPIVDKDIRELVNKIQHQQQQDILLSLLFRFHQIFDTTKHSIANTSIHHVIKTIPHVPPACKPYPQPDKEEAMYSLIQEFLQAGLITESHSPYAAPAILVKKKDGQYRFVVDYKKLNLITIKDSSPLPNMEETLRKLGQGYKYFSKLDFKSGFYQIPINETDKEKTAFVTPFGLYQFNVLPMGLINSPPTFQKVMNNTLQSCRQFCLVYLDDIIVFSKSHEEHISHLEQVFTALQTNHFVLNPPKCELMVSKINYLGHTISEKIITPTNDKIQAILDIKEPHTLARANKFIGALSWYRKFIPNFATIAAPIHAVTNLNKNDRRKFKWTSAQSNAFHQLKQMLTTAPLFLHFPVDNQPFILTTDASDFGIGGVLQQEVNGQ
ncbi:unnamed protein product, partial [Rotaria sp. Silwood2]